MKSIFEEIHQQLKAEIEIAEEITRHTQDRNIGIKHVGLAEGLKKACIIVEQVERKYAPSEVRVTIPMLRARDLHTINQTSDEP